MSLTLKEWVDTTIDTDLYLYGQLDESQLAELLTTLKREVSAMFKGVDMLWLEAYTVARVRA